MSPNQFKNARYVNPNGDQLWEEQYLFRRLYQVGQTFIRNSVEYMVEDVKVVDDLCVVTIQPLPPVPILGRSIEISPIREAMIETVIGLKQKVLTTDKLPRDGVLSQPHLNKLLQEILDNSAMHLDKANRWIGYVQGVLACHGVIDVEEERNRTRPFFEKAYAQGRLVFIYESHGEP